MSAPATVTVRDRIMAALSETEGRTYLDVLDQLDGEPVEVFHAFMGLLRSGTIRGELRENWREYEVGRRKLYFRVPGGTS